MNTVANFPVTLYGKLTPYSDTISKGRCGIFYRGGNRNGSYITDEFAEKLIKTLPYAPVKGIYSVDDEDYTDHGTERTEGRIYGIAPGPNDLNFAWEEHEDPDGVIRTYACVDVYYYTALYKEAKDIPGKGQSMELYGKSIKGDWKIIDGKKYYVFEDAAFLGLQVLGDGVEPCFEGAQFFSVYNSLKDTLEKLEEYKDRFQIQSQGGEEMPNMEKINFKLSDDEKFNALWALLNTNFNEEGEWIVEYGIAKVYDEYAVVVNYFTGDYERVYYTKDDSTDSLEITKRERCYIVDVNEEEKKALDGTYALNENTFVGIDEKLNSISALNEEISSYSTKVEELNNNISTLTTERDESQSQIDTLNAQISEMNNTFTEHESTISTLTEERDNLASFKKEIELGRKQAIVDNYVNDLSEETIAEFTSNLDNYSEEELDMKLTYAVKKANPDMFTKEKNKYTPQLETKNSGITSILSKYENK